MFWFSSHSNSMRSFNTLKNIICFVGLIFGLDYGSKVKGKGIGKYGWFLILKLEHFLIISRMKMRVDPQELAGVDRRSVRKEETKYYQTHYNCDYNDHTHLTKQKAQRFTQHTHVGLCKKVKNTTEQEKEIVDEHPGPRTYFGCEINCHDEYHDCQFQILLTKASGLNIHSFLV